MTDAQRIREIIRLLHQYSARLPLKFPNDAEISSLAKKLLKAANGPTSLRAK